MPVSTPNSPLPLLFGKTRRDLGWQGYSTQVPDGWNPGKFSGTRARGDLRVDDEIGVRLELRWEDAKKVPDVGKSVANFLQTLEKEAKKRRQPFQRVEGAKSVSRGRKKQQQVTSFGWIGDPQAASSCGFGAAWFCPVCNRVTSAHIIGQAGEKPEKIERLASEILTPLQCHGEGGWDTWSFYGLHLEIPVEFELARAQMLLNRTELEWIRPRPLGIVGWGRRDERLRLERFPAANVLLADISLEAWVSRRAPDKKGLRLLPAGQTEVNGHEAILLRGGSRDLRVALSVWFFDRLLRRRTPRGEGRVWNCPASNRIWSMESEVSAVNAHVVADVLGSLQCH